MKSINDNNSNAISEDLLGFTMNTLFVKKKFRRNATHKKDRVGISSWGG